MCLIWALSLVILGKPDVFQNKSGFLDNDNKNMFCLTRSVVITIMWSTMWTTASQELSWYLCLIFCLVCSGGSNRAGDDGGKSRTGGTSVSLRHPAILACQSRRESLSALLSKFTRFQISVKSKYLLFEDKELIRIFNNKTVQRLLGRGVPGWWGSRGKEKWVK